MGFFLKREGVASCRFLSKCLLTISVLTMMCVLASCSGANEAKRQVQSVPQDEAAQSASQEPKSKNEERDESSDEESEASMASKKGPLTADEAKYDSERIFIKRGDQFYRLTTCQVDDSHQGTQSTAVKLKDDNAEMAVINLSDGDELAMFRQGYHSFKKVVHEAYVYPNTVQSSDNLSFWPGGAMVEIDGVEVKDNSLDLLAAKGIHMNDRYFLEGPQGASFKGGYYKGTDFVEKTFVIDTRLFFLEKSHSTFSAGGLELGEIKTKEGYSLLDTESLEAGVYRYYYDPQGQRKNTTFMVEVV